MNFDFDFNKKMNRGLIYELATARFIARREHPLFLGRQVPLPIIEDLDKRQLPHGESGLCVDLPSTVCRDPATEGVRFDRDLPSPNGSVQARQLRHDPTRHQIHSFLIANHGAERWHL